MTVIEEIKAERIRQVEEKGFDSKHDALQNQHGELADAAACYAATLEPFTANGSDLWPWYWSWDKRDEHDQRRRLIIAGALIVAEIERLDREKP